MDDDKQHAKELVNIGRAFREAREQRGLSQREVADAVRGISLDGIRKIEAGKRDLDYARFVRLARALGVERSTIVLRADSLSAD
jgi:transcriptional regulator with XRE-family HTH domain